MIVNNRSVANRHIDTQIQPDTWTQRQINTHVIVKSSATVECKKDGCSVVDYSYV